MTEILNLDSISTDFEADVAALALSPDAQDLLFREAHTAYAFTDEPVSDEQLRAVYDLVKWAPTAMNSQPLRVVLVRTAKRGPDWSSTWAETTRPGWPPPRWSPFWPLTSTSTTSCTRRSRLCPVPASGSSADEAARERSARFSAGLQAAYFLVGVRAAGLGAGPMTGFDAAGIDAEFFPDGDHRTLMVVNIGRTADDGQRPRLPRLDYDEVVTSV